jgi:hypothetical protein
MALVLMLAIPMLVTMARRSLYVPSSDHGQHLFNASKAKLAHGSKLKDHSPLRVVIVPVTSESSFCVEWHLEPASSRASNSVDPSVSRQLRSPPVSLA